MSNLLDGIRMKDIWNENRYFEGTEFGFGLSLGFGLDSSILVWTTNARLRHSIDCGGVIRYSPWRDSPVPYGVPDGTNQSLVHR